MALFILHQAVRGFKNMHIEGAELVHLGQQTDLGKIHIHLQWYCLICITADL